MVNMPTGYLPFKFICPKWFKTYIALNASCYNINIMLRDS